MKESSSKKRNRKYWLYFLIFILVFFILVFSFIPAKKVKNKEYNYNYQEKSPFKFISPEKNEISTESKSDFLNSLFPSSFRQAIKNKFVLEPLLDRYRTEKGKKNLPHIVIYGPPGVGKSFCAEKIAKNISHKYIIIGGGSLIDKYWGQSYQNWLSILEGAEKEAEKIENNKPIVIIIEEIDSVLVKQEERTSNKKDNSLIDGILNDIDRINKMRKPILIFGTTNFPNLLNEASIRSGRLEMIKLDYPKEIKQLEELINQVKKVSEKINWKTQLNKEIWGKKSISEKLTINFTDEFWKGVIQETKKIYLWLKNSPLFSDSVGFSFIDLEKSIESSIRAKVSEKNLVIVPSVVDYRKNLEEIIQLKMDAKRFS